MADFPTPGCPTILSREVDALSRIEVAVENLLQFADIHFYGFLFMIVSLGNPRRTVSGSDRPSYIEYTICAGDSNISTALWPHPYACGSAWRTRIEACFVVSRPGVSVWPYARANTIRPRIW
jgi:hypothetical protein